MGWTQEEIADVYKSVKQVVAEIDITSKSRKQVVAKTRQKLRYQFGYRPYVRGSVLFNGNYGRGNRKFKTFIKQKYSKIGLPSKEISMLDKMIDTVVDSLKCNETSLSDLDSTVSKMNTIAHRAKNINSDCEDIMEELDKISDYLDEKCQAI